MKSYTWNGFADMLKVNDANRNLEKALQALRQAKQRVANEKKKQNEKKRKAGGCKKSCVYVEIIFPDMNQICKNLLSDIATFMLSNFFSNNSIASNYGACRENLEHIPIGTIPKFV